MSVLKLYNTITLREQPDLSPIADASFEKCHSFIYPGDEIVICTKLKNGINAMVGGNLFGGNFNGVVFQSVKCSIIAKKPNIFSEEFDSTFAATRSFELDSFTVPLNNSTAPFVPWPALGGYGPNINFTQDRNWQLPSGDFKRQINFFTKTILNGFTGHVDYFEYNFWFPIIFREEYWLALQAADNDFYDTAQPQNGKNQKWLRYHNLSILPFGWQIHAKFELKYTKFGVQNSIISEYNLSNEATGIQDYNSNTDYTTKSIKTCKVGGTPSNTPVAPVFGTENTSVFSYFTKVASWEI